MICRLGDRDLVIAGDAIYTIGQLADAPEPPRPLDRHRWRRSMRELQHFARTYPQAVILPGHDPEHWKTVQPRYAVTRSPKDEANRADVEAPYE